MSILVQTNSAAPSVPATNKVNVYHNTSGQTVAQNSTGVTNILNNTRNPNYVRNGGFWFAQRQNPASATTYSATASRAITADGWGVTNENASVTYARTDTNAAAEAGLQGQFYGTYLKITNTGKMVVSQMLESKDAIQLRGRTVRLQMWLKATASATVNIAMAYLTTSGTIDSSPATFISAFGANGVNPTLGTNVTYIAPKSGVSPDNATPSTNCAQCAVTTAWQRFGAVFDIPANLKNLYVLVYGHNQFTATNGFSISQVSLSDGPELQDWAPMPYEQELRRTLRYYEKSFGIDTLPATNVGAGTNEWRHSAPKGAAAAANTPTFRYNVYKRSTSPTLTLYNPSAANAQMRDITGAADCTVTAAATSTDKAFSLGYTGAAGTAAGNVMGINWSADAELI